MFRTFAPLTALLIGLGAVSPIFQPLAAQVGASGTDGKSLRPGDIIRLRIWREPDLSGDFPVDPEGRVVLPKLGPLSVTGIEPDSLRRRLLADYSEYLRNPSVEVTLLRRVNVLGAVRTPGLYPVDMTMTLADVLALAGGASPEGKPDQVALVRDGQRVEVKLDQGTRMGDTPIQPGDQLYVPQRSWLSRNPWILAAGLSAVTTAIFAFAQ